MLRSIFFSTAILVVSFTAVAKPKPGPASTDDAKIERGRYLVEEVAMCTECHTPRDSRGELDHNAWLQGAPVWIMPVHSDTDWASRAPALAGFPSLSEKDGETVLEKGTDPSGLPLRPPMHIYHMSHEDAQAIIAYLKTVPQKVH